MAGVLLRAKRAEDEIVVYQPDETIRLDVRLENETVWLNRQQMAVLFGRDVKTIGKHIANALRQELADPAVGAKNATTEGVVPVVAKFATTAADGKTYQVEYYSLDVVLSVGYRVNSPQGILFRRWATQVLTMLGARGKGVSCKICTKNYSRKLRLDLARYNAQYDPIEIRPYTGAHDRFLILDDAVVYHVGASLKDLGRSLFAFSRLQIPASEILSKLP